MRNPDFIIKQWLQNKVGLLKALSATELRQVAAAATTREYPIGRTIVSEGEAGKEMFVLQVSKHDEFCITNEEFCITNEEFCIKKEEFCTQNYECCRAGGRR